MVVRVERKKEGQSRFGKWAGVQVLGIIGLCSRLKSGCGFYFPRSLLMSFAQRNINSIIIIIILEAPICRVHLMH